jgi:hypothetical protein
LPAPVASLPLFATHSLTATPPSSTASCGFKRSAPPKELLLSSSSVHASPLLLLMPCRCRPPCPAIGAPLEGTTPPLPGRPSFRSFLREKALGTTATAATPRPPDTSRRQASPAALPLHRRRPNDRPCPGHLFEPQAADHHHRTPPLTAVPLRPSCAPWKLPLRCALLSDVLPVVSAPRRVALAPLPGPPCRWSPPESSGHRHRD